MLNVVREGVLVIYNDFQFAEERLMKFSIIMQKFEEDYLPRKNETFERHRFFTSLQKLDKSI